MACATGILRCCAVLFVIMGIALAPNVAVAELGRTPRAHAELIHFAGRNRMLTQQMTKAVCFAVLGIDTEAQNEAAHLAAMEFDATIDTLIKGALAHGQVTERDYAVRSVLQDVREISEPLTRSTKQLAGGDIHTIALSVVINRNEPALKRMDDAVTLMEQDANQQIKDRAINATINKTGLQRMLSQKIAKNACLILADLQVEQSRKALGEDIEIFEAKLDQLLDGDEKIGIKRPTTAGIATQLQEVSARWRTIKPALLATADGTSSSAEELVEIGLACDQLTAMLDRVVLLWVGQLG